MTTTAHVSAAERPLGRPGADNLAGLDVEKVRKDFPALERIVHGDKPLVYLDNAATSQKPRQVLDALDDYYTRHNANVHRGIHVLAEEATALYEGARDKVARFVNAADTAEIVFTKNSTEALNLVSNVLGYAGEPRGLGPGDEVVITEMEHHSNIVPWQMVTGRTGATLRWFSLTDDGRLDLSDIDAVITERTKVVSFVLVSNILGTVNPPEDLVRRAHEVGALVVVDASQAAPHMPLDVQALGADLVAFTGHKMCGPTGIGALWGRKGLLEELPPFLGGGEMIEMVTMATSTYAAVPHKFEAGTPPIAQAVGLGAAVDYLTGLGMDNVHAHEQRITAYALERLQQVEGLRIIGPATTESRGAAVSFALGDLHPHDVGQVLDELGIAVRVGHHCARPVCLRYAVPATTRASFYLYNTEAEVDALVAGLEHVQHFFAGDGVGGAR
jgi:cysteine desulfurase / selenocysteine lyase